ncbi:YfiR family protein [Azospira sp.]|uniref:YfiR family protein n=1 Tax=Azospira sp. TaxID=1872671 RepID=UPI00255FF0CE|nr:YfiR family protein [Azospira sp.]
MRRCLLLLCCWPLWALANPPSEAAVKAALVANLANYAEWGEGNWSVKHTLICVAGRGAVVDSLLALDSQTLLGRRIGVSPRSRPAEARDCQVLFLGDAPGRSQGDWDLEWTQALATAPVLTVCEGEDLVSQGCMVGLAREGTQVAFDVNLAALRRANIRLSAHLLRLARTIYGRPR